MGCSQGKKKKVLRPGQRLKSNVKIAGMELTENKYILQNNRTNFQFEYIFYKRVIMTSKSKGKNLTLTSRFNYSSQTSSYSWNFTDNIQKSQNYFISESPEPERIEISNFTILPLPDSLMKVRIFIDYAEFFIESSDKIKQHDSKNNYNLDFSQSLRLNSIWNLECANKELNQFSFQNEESGLYLCSDAEKGFLSSTKGDSIVWTLFESPADPLESSAKIGQIDQNAPQVPKNVPDYLQEPISFLMGIQLLISNKRFGYISPNLTNSHEVVDDYVYPNDQIKGSEGFWEIFYLSDGYIIYHIKSMKFLGINDDFTLVLKDQWDRTRFQFMEHPSQEGYVVTILLQRNQYLSVNKVSSQLMMNVVELDLSIVDGKLQGEISPEHVWIFETQNKLEN